MPSRKLPYSEVRRMVAMYEGGKSLGQVATEMHLSKTCVGSYLRGRVKMRPVGGNNRPVLHDGDDRVARAVELYVVGGYNTTEIAEMMGTGHSVVCRWLRVGGVTLRDRSESLRLRAARG